MFRLLVLIGLGVAGYMVAKQVLGSNSAAPDADDLYGSAEIHEAADRPPVS